MHKFLVISIFAALVTAGPVAAERPPYPAISMAQARATALRLAPGRIISSEYEKERGGWRYSFDIQQGTHVQEIGIDGQTGRVVENKSEGKKDRDLPPWQIGNDE